MQGSGVSDGDFVTLGANEVDDLEALVRFIRDGGHASAIALWGRSMGAVTALLYSERDPSIAGNVLDSPFSRLTDLMWELVEQQRFPMRRYLGGTALKMLRKSVKKRAGFDINDLSPIDHAPRAFTPALFGHALRDTFVASDHTRRLAAEYAGDHEVMLFPDCDHNSPRPQAFYNGAASFLARVLAGANEGGVHIDVAVQGLGRTHSGTALDLSAVDVAELGDGMPDAAAELLQGCDDTDTELQSALEQSLRECRAARDAADCDAADSTERIGSPGETHGTQDALSMHALRSIDTNSSCLEGRECTLHGGAAVSGEEREEAMLMAAIRMSLADEKGAPAAQRPADIDESSRKLSS